MTRLGRHRAHERPELRIAREQVGRQPRAGAQQRRRDHAHAHGQAHQHLPRVPTSLLPFNMPGSAALSTPMPRRQAR